MEGGIVVEDHLPDLDDMEWWYQPEGGRKHKEPQEKMPTQGDDHDLPCESGDLEP